MGNRRTWAIAVAAATATALAAFAKPPDARLTDLSVYLGAVSGLAEGAGLYDFTRGAAPFTYPPFAALLFTPLTWLPVGFVQVVWTFATLTTVAVLAILVGRHRPDLPAAAAAVALVLSAPVSSDVKYGQVSLFLAALVLADFLLLRRTPWHGTLIGLAAAVKLTPLIFIALLWCTARRPAAARALATFAACALVAALALPGDSWTFWSDKLFEVSRLGHITGVGNQSLNGALMRLGVDAHGRTVLILTVGGTIAIAALRRAVRHRDPLTAVVVLGAASVVLSPVSWTHHQIWLVLAALLPVDGRPWARVAWPATVLVVMLLPLTALGPPLFSESRLLLAVATAALLPLAAVGTDHPPPVSPCRPSVSGGGRTLHRDP